MPTYDYECTSCGHTFDTFQNMSDAPLTTCPQCETEALKRLIGGGVGIIFKGSGFYVNDSRGKKGGSGSASGAESASTNGGSSESKKSDSSSSESSSESNGSGESKKSEGTKSDAAVGSKSSSD